jgi:fumarylacetoacetase
MTAETQPSMNDLDQTHDPETTSWVASASAHLDFGLQNLPFGIFADAGGPRGGVRIGDEVVDLAALAETGLLTGTALQAARAAAAASLNPLFALGPGPRRDLRVQLHALLSEGSASQKIVEVLLHPVKDVRVLMPAVVGDYTDFYVGVHHAMNVGTLFRPDNPLLPNYRWVPIGYHGRASSIQVSGTSFRRPRGQLKAPDAATPTFAPTRRLDIELELGVWIGSPNNQGEPIPVDQAPDHVAGYCLLNDWSARDVQAWEYQPLGPFLSKNFATTVSAWVVTPEALKPFRIPLTRPEDDPAPLPYLRGETDQRVGGLDLELEVLLSTVRLREQQLPEVSISRSSTRHMYWSVAQMITHHTSGGCNLRSGDLLGSGTISAPTKGGFGSLLEITHGGTEPIQMPSGETRTFLEDGDEIILRARARGSGAASIGFGECRAIVQPALTTDAVRPA